MQAILADIRYAVYQKTQENGSFPLSDTTDVNEQLAQHIEQCKFCFTIEDSKTEKLSASGVPGPRWGFAQTVKPQLPWIRLVFDPHFSTPSAVYE